MTLRRFRGTKNKNLFYHAMSLGSEFISWPFTGLLSDWDIDHKLTSATWKNKAFLIENRWRFVRRLLGKFKKLKNTAHVTHLLPAIERTINETPTRPTGLPPALTRNSHAPDILARLKRQRGKMFAYLPPMFSLPKLARGDRILMEKWERGKFEKTSDPVLQPGIFTIAEVHKREPQPRYSLIDDSYKRPLFGTWPAKLLHRFEDEPQQFEREEKLTEAEKSPKTRRPLTRSQIRKN
ncbi:MAG: hypothetical protein ABFS03_08190 [Chloroflexota bacterium]